MKALYSIIEFQQVTPLLTDLEVEAAVREAISLQLGGLCIPPYWVKKASRDTLPVGIQLITVIGYPYGYQRTEAKLAEMELAFTDGAQEVELMINLSALKSQRWNWIKAEIARFSKGAHDKEKIFTVGVDTSVLTLDETLKLCKDATDAGADYIKTTAVLASPTNSLAKISTIREALHASVGLKSLLMPQDEVTIQSLTAAGVDKICIPDLALLQQYSAKT